MGHWLSGPKKVESSLKLNGTLKRVIHFLHPHKIDVKMKKNSIRTYQNSESKRRSLNFPERKQ
jgi:hypothetical protein